MENRIQNGCILNRLFPSGFKVCFQVKRTSNVEKLKQESQDVWCWFNLPFKTQGKFLAVANKVIILSGVTTYFLCQTDHHKQPKEAKPTDPLESIQTCTDIYPDRTSPKGNYKDIDSPKNTTDSACGSSWNNLKHTENFSWGFA